jgi:hypothetical protein
MANETADELMDFLLEEFLSIVLSVKAYVFLIAPNMAAVTNMLCYLSSYLLFSIEYYKLCYLSSYTFNLFKFLFACKTCY